MLTVAFLILFICVKVLQAEIFLAQEGRSNYTCTNSPCKLLCKAGDVDACEGVMLRCRGHFPCELICKSAMGSGSACKDASVICKDAVSFPGKSDEDICGATCECERTIPGGRRVISAAAASTLSAGICDRISILCAGSHHCDLTCISRHGTATEVGRVCEKANVFCRRSEICNVNCEQVGDDRYNAACVNLNIAGCTGGKKPRCYCNDPLNFQNSPRCVFSLPPTPFPTKYPSDVGPSNGGGTGTLPSTPNTLAPSLRVVHTNETSEAGSAEPVSGSPTISHFSDESTPTPSLDPKNDYESTPSPLDDEGKQTDYQQGYPLAIILFTFAGCTIIVLGFKRLHKTRSRHRRQHLKADEAEKVNLLELVEHR